MTDFVYTPASTSITERWRRIYNWTPPSEDPAYIKKWSDFRAMSARGVEALDLPIEIPRLTTVLKWKIQ
jgi:hypothetical protein